MDFKMQSVRKSFLFALVCIIAFLISPVADVKAALSDGTYSLNYTVISPNDESASIANDYFVKPAKLFVENGTMKVQLTLKNSEWITDFKGQNGGNLVVSSNKAADTRVIQFNVNSLSSPLVSTMKVDIDDMNYHHEYTVRLKFDESSLSLLSSPAKEEGSSNANVSTGEQANGQKDFVENPQTSDAATISWFVLLLVGSLFLLVKQLKKS